MSFLCGKNEETCDKSIFSKVSANPSPGRQLLLRFFSRIERTSLLQGSMTLEAAVVLPCFLFFFINLSSALEMIALQGNLKYALHNAGNELCLYGSLLTDPVKDLGGTGHVSAAPVSDGDNPSDDTSSEIVTMAEGMALSYTYVKYRMVEELGEEYLSSSPLKSGSGSLNFIGSDIGGAGDIVDIKLSCMVTTPVRTIGTDPFLIFGRYYGHLWNGYEIEGTSAELSQEKIVYITEDSEVYHTTPACTHLRLSIRGVESSSIPDQRNISGGRYYPCEICASGDVPDFVYIGAQGDRYHYTDDCYTLMRSYTPVPLSEVELSHRPCSRCGGG